MNIWAHRGLCRKYPENTLTAFRAAMKFDITGIELDVQLTKDGYPVVIHDETVDRTTDGCGRVAGLTLSAVKELNIPFGDLSLKIPTLEEVLDSAKIYCLKYGLLINIELKNSIVQYPGMEEKVVRLVRESGLEGFVIYSSFNPDSLKIIRRLSPDAETGVLGYEVNECLNMAADTGCRVIHPYLKHIKMPLPLTGYTVRAWSMRPAEPFYGEAGTGEKYDIKKLAAYGITDLITNNCDYYCRPREGRPALTEKLYTGSVDPVTGLIVQDHFRRVNREPVRVEKGMIIRRLRNDLHYQLAFYSEETDPSLIYEYKYDPESNFSTYRPEKFIPDWLDDELTVSEDGYIRVCTDISEAAKTGDIISVSGRLRAFAWTAGNGCAEEYLDTCRKAAGHDAKFILLADTHYCTNSGWESSFENIKRVSRRIHPDSIIHLGDLTDGLLPGSLTRRYAGRVLQDLHSIGPETDLCIGNHDTNYFRDNPDVFSSRECSRFYLGRNTGHYYKDHPGRKLRLIFLDSYDPREEERYGFTKTAAAWLARTLLLTPRDYRIIIFSHVPPLARIHIWSETIRNEKCITGAAEACNEKHGNILAWICGHNHSDLICRDLSFPVITIGCGKLEECTYRKPDEFITEKRSPYDLSRYLFDVMIVRENNDIEFVRFGAGHDRSIIHHDPSY